MNSIADSEAIESQRMLTQHQAALTLLQGLLTKPELKSFRWLDLASGRGQIIANLKENLSAEARAKIRFLGYDIDNAHSRVAEKTAQTIGLAGHDFVIGEIECFYQNSSTDGPWDFVTLTNAVHEIPPSSLAMILIECVSRLSDDGCFFVYDMEELPSLELGAVTWTADEMRTILHRLSSALGSTVYRPEVGKWRHKSCAGWNSQLRRSDMRLPANWRGLMGEAAKATNVIVQELLTQKLSQVTVALEGLTRFGAETPEESATKTKLAFDFWAISRALRGTT